MSGIFFLYNRNIGFSKELFILNRVDVLEERLCLIIVLEIVWLLCNGTESSVTFYLVCGI